MTELSAAEVERTAYRRRLEAFLACRDAGNTLTLDSLRAGIRLDTVIGAAADLAAYADEALAIVSDEYRPALHCRKGCWYCCCKPGVLTAIPEFLRILDHIRATFDAGARAGLKDRVRRYVTQLAGRSFNAPVNESIPCPLLVDGLCSVYEVRPLVCRGYNSTDVEACRRAHQDAGELVPMFAMLKDVTDGLTVGAAQRLKAAGFNAALVDLGTALSLALDAGPGFSDAVIEGGTALSPAENSSWVSTLWARVRKTARQVGLRF